MRVKHGWAVHFSTCQLCRFSTSVMVYRMPPGASRYAYSASSPVLQRQTAITHSVSRELQRTSLARKHPLDDAAAVVALLELRVREAEEELRELPLAEVVRQVAHRVGPER